MSVSLLTKEPSMLSAMFSGNFSTKPDEDGSYFIDRDPKYFPIILNYLRNNTLDIKEMSHKELRALKEEIEYYQIGSLIALFNNEGFCVSVSVFL